jgi:hypothetical protein
VLSTMIFSVEMKRSTSVLGCVSPSGACINKTCAICYKQQYKEKRTIILNKTLVSGINIKLSLCLSITPWRCILCLINAMQCHAMLWWHIWWSGSIAPNFLNLSARQRWVVSFMSWLFWLLGKEPWYPFDMGWVSPEAIWMQWQREKKYPCPCWESNPGCPTHSSITILTDLK